MTRRLRELIERNPYGMLSVEEWEDMKVIADDLHHRGENFDTVYTFYREVRDVVDRYARNAKNIDEERAVVKVRRRVQSRLDEMAGTGKPPETLFQDFYSVMTDLKVHFVHTAILPPKKAN